MPTTRIKISRYPIASSILHLNKKPIASRIMPSAIIFFTGVSWRALGSIGGRTILLLLVSFWLVLS